MRGEVLLNFTVNVNSKFRKGFFVKFKKKNFI